MMYTPTGNSLNQAGPTIAFTVRRRRAPHLCQRSI